MSEAGHIACSLMLGVHGQRWPRTDPRRGVPFYLQPAHVARPRAFAACVVELPSDCTPAEDTTPSARNRPERAPKAAPPAAFTDSQPTYAQLRTLTAGSRQCSHRLPGCQSRTAAPGHKRCPTAFVHRTDVQRPHPQPHRSGHVPAANDLARSGRGLPRPKPCETGAAMWSAGAASRAPTTPAHSYAPTPSPRRRGG